MTTMRYQESNRTERLEYRLARSSWVILLGYLTVFLFGMCISPLINDFRRNWQIVGTLCLHFWHNCGGRRIDGMVVYGVCVCSSYDFGHADGCLPVLCST